MAKYWLLILVSCSAFAGSALASSWKDPELAIRVRLYRGYPGADTFSALNELGQILVQNTAKGFLARSVVDRDDVHPGATVCLQVHPGLSDPKAIHSKIVKSIQALKPDGQFIEFHIETPSRCMDSYF